MQVIICDDDKLFGQRLKEKISAHPRVTAGDVEVTVVFSLTALSNLNMAEATLLFLDIQLLDGDGVEWMAAFREQHCYSGGPDVVYVSYYERDVVAVANTRPFGFISKTDSDEGITAAVKAFLDRWFIQRQQDEAIFYYRANGVDHYLRINDIRYFEKEGRLVTPYSGQGAGIPFYMKMKELIDRLDNPQFIQINQSYLVNYRHIEEIRRKGREVILADGTRLFISQGKWKQVHNQLVQLNMKKH